jgi:hypothetical protein
MEEAVTSQAQALFGARRAYGSATRSGFSRNVEDEDFEPQSPRE